MMSVSKRSFQSDVVLCGYSLIWVNTPVCCSEAVMAAADDGGVAAAALAVWSSLSIVLMLFVNICRKGCFNKLKYSVFLIRPLGLLKGVDRHCKDLAMAKFLKILQFPVKPSVVQRNF